MKCPTPCYQCKDIVELHHLHFRTTLCDCSVNAPLGECSHGICDDCFYSEDEEDRFNGVNDEWADDEE